MLYRWSPHDHALPQLVALDASGDEIPPIYYNPMMLIIAGSESVESKGQTRLPSTSGNKRPDPRSKRDEMLTGLETALQKRKIRPGMTQVELHVAMLDALEIPRNATPRGFEYDAFRKHCRA